MTKKYLVFEFAGKRFGVDVTELALIASDCSYLGYDGLPAHVSGLVHYAGKVYPVLNLKSLVKEASIDENKKPVMFLFSNKLVDSGDPSVISEFALPIYSDVKMTQAGDNEDFEVLSLTRISSMFF